MAALATVADLQTFMQRTFTVAETAEATLVIDLASASIQDYTGQTISAVANDVVTLDPPYGSYLFLPELPVTAVASVTVGGTALALGSPTVDGYYWYGDTGTIRYGGYRGYAWGWAPKSVVVTYSHGYATIPDAVRAVTLEAAAQMMGSGPAGGLQSESIGNYSYERSGAGQAVADVAGGRLDRYKLMVLA